MPWPNSRLDAAPPVVGEAEIRRNRVLSSFPEPHFTAWRRWLEPVAMGPGDVIHEAGDRLRYVYFPLNATVSLQNVLANGTGTQIGIVGREGVVGITAFLGGGLLGTRAMVQSAGLGARIDAELAKDEFNHGGPPVDILLRYANALMVQMSQTAVCNRYHSAEQQLCRWLLLSLDRVDGDELQTTQELIATALGVRRETIADAVQKLQRRGAIRHRRGHILVVDRAQIERTSCECYHVVRHRYDELLNPG
jgi:CRP-like cAMP-binding protein